MQDAKLAQQKIGIYFHIIHACMPCFRACAVVLVANRWSHPLHFCFHKFCCMIVRLLAFATGIVWYFVHHTTIWFYAELKIFCHLIPLRCKNGLVVLTTLALVTWGGSGYERFILLLETNYESLQGSWSRSSHWQSWEYLQSHYNCKVIREISMLLISSPHRIVVESLFCLLPLMQFVSNPKVNLS